MPDYQVTFVRDNRMFQATISGYGFRDAFENLKALKETGVISDELEQEIHAPEMDIEKARRLAK